MDTTFLSVLTAIASPFAAGLLYGWIRATALMRIFAMNHGTAKPVAVLISYSNWLGLLGSMLLAATLLGEDFGTLWLVTAMTLFVLGKKTYTRHLALYSRQRIQETMMFLQSLIKQSIED